MERVTPFAACRISARDSKSNPELSLSQKPTKRGLLPIRHNTVFCCACERLVAISPQPWRISTIHSLAWLLTKAISSRSLSASLEKRRRLSLELFVLHCFQILYVV